MEVRFPVLAMVGQGDDVVELRLASRAKTDRTTISGALVFLPLENAELHALGNGRVVSLPTPFGHRSSHGVSPSLSDGRGGALTDAPRVSLVKKPLLETSLKFSPAIIGIVIALAEFGTGRDAEMRADKLRDRTPDRREPFA